MQWPPKQKSLRWPWTTHCHSLKVKRCPYRSQNCSLFFVFSDPNVARLQPCWFVIHASQLCWLRRELICAGQSGDIKAGGCFKFKHAASYVSLKNLYGVGFSATETLLLCSAQRLMFTLLRRVSRSDGRDSGHSSFPLTLRRWAFVFCGKGSQFCFS